MTIKQLAKLLNTSPDTIYRHIRCGDLNVSDPASIERFKNRTRKRPAGRPVKYVVNYEVKNDDLC